MATRIPISKEVNNFDDRQKKLWADMELDMDRRRREWEGEIEKMRKEFFTLRPDKGAEFNKIEAPRMAAPLHVVESDDGKPVMERDEQGNPVFKVRFNMKEYRPEEVNVKMDNDKIMVSARHEEKGEGSSISREYNREVNVPSDIDPLSLQCVFQPDGNLVFSAPLPAPKYNAVKDSPAPTPASHNVVKTSSSYQKSNTQHGNDGHVTTVPVSTHTRESPHRQQPIQMQHQAQVRSQPTTLNNHQNVTTTSFAKSSPTPQSSVSTLNISGANAHPDHIVPSFKPPPDLSQLDNKLLEDPTQPLSSHLLHSASPSRLLNSSPLPKPPPFNALNSSFPAGPIFPEATHQAQLSNPVVTSHDGKFQLTMPIDDFKPEELTVKTQDQKVIICAKRQVSSGNRNHTMEMNREHSLPDNVDPLTVKAFFTDTNKLIVEAPFLQS